MSTYKAAFAATTMLERLRASGAYVTALYQAELIVMLEEAGFHDLVLRARNAR